MTPGEWISAVGLFIVGGGVLVAAGVLVGELRGLAEAVGRLSISVDKLDAKIDEHSDRLARLESK